MTTCNNTFAKRGMPEPADSLQGQLNQEVAVLPRVFPSITATAAVIILAVVAYAPLAVRAQAQRPIPCSEERDSTVEIIRPSGGSINEKYAEVEFPPGAYTTDTSVTMKAHPDNHGITISPSPAEPVIVRLRLDFCGIDENADFRLLAGNDTLNAYKSETGWWLWNRKWAGAVVDPSAFQRELGETDLPPFSGFVVLSN